MRRARHVLATAPQQDSRLAVTPALTLKDCGLCHILCPKSIGHRGSTTRRWCGCVQTGSVPWVGRGRACLPTRRVGCCTSPARTSTAATGSPSHAPEPTGVRARVSAGVPPRLRPPVLYLWLASSSGRPVRQSAQAVSSVSRRSRRPTYRRRVGPRRRADGRTAVGVPVLTPPTCTAHMHRPQCTPPPLSRPTPAV
jgi:hypothetical protein